MDALLAAQAKVDAVAQTTTRRMALGLAALFAALAVMHGVWLPVAHVRELLPMALLTGAAQVAMAFWLRAPRPAGQLRAIEGAAALLAAATGLLDLALTGDPTETLHLLLIWIGAGFFVLSTPWLAAVSTLLAAGWTGLAWRTGFPPGCLHFGAALVFAALLAWLLHASRRRMLQDMLALETRELAAQAEQRRLVEELQGAMDRIRTLKGLIPICAKCKQVRDDHGFWQQVEVFVEKHSHAEFTHGLCPHCLALAKAEWEQEIPE